MDAFSIDQIIQPFKDVLQQETSGLKDRATYLFYYLATFELAFTTIWMLLAGEGFEKLINKLVVLAFTLGIFYECVINGGFWISNIINGFMEVGSDLGRITLNPVEIMSIGLKLVKGVMAGSHNWGVIKAIGIAFMAAILGIAFIGIFALITAEVIVVLVKSYFLSALSSLFFAFAGTELTREMTVRYFQTVLGVGLQIMTLYILVGIGQSITERWLVIVDAAMKNKDLMPVLAIFGGLIVYFILVKVMPVFIASLAGVGRLQNYSGQAIAAGVGAAIAYHKLNESLKGVSTSAAVSKLVSMGKPSESTKPISPKPPQKKELNTSNLVPTSPYPGHIIKK